MIGATSIASCVVFVDADNTLWDTNQIYADAQLVLLSAVERLVGHQAPTSNRLGWLREIDQALAKRHHAKLRYPARLLVKAAALALEGQDVLASTRLAWSGGTERSRISEEDAIRIERDFKTQLKRIPQLRDGVRTGLQNLKEAGCHIVVLTEASRLKVINLLQHHGLFDLVDRVIESRKECRLFKRVLRLTSQPSHVFMVGDQLESDIRPAKQAGLRTIYFPGGFRPSWEPTESAVRPDYRIERFDEVTAIVVGGLAQEVANA